MEVSLLQPNDITPETEQQISVLLKQLNPALNLRQVKQRIDAASNVHWLCAREGEELLGMASLAIYQVLSGCKGWIEDVVVDQEHRRQGIARALTEELIRLAEVKGVDRLMLYTGHHRTGAQRLYQSCGFRLKDSHLYIMDIK